MLFAIERKLERRAKFRFACNMAFSETISQNFKYYEAIFIL